MRLLLQKVAILLLLPALLVTSSGDALGYAWCLGEDGHVEIKRAAPEACCAGDRNTVDTVRNAGPSLHPSTADQCRSCLDFSARQGEAVFSKRLKRASAAPIDALAPNLFLSLSAQRATLVIRSLVAQTPPRISQTLLAHRTVVLRC